MSNKEGMNLPARPKSDHVDADTDERKKRSEYIEKEKDDYEKRQQERQDKEQIQRFD